MPDDDPSVIASADAEEQQLIAFLHLIIPSCGQKKSSENTQEAQKTEYHPGQNDYRCKSFMSSQTFFFLTEKSDGTKKTFMSLFSPLSLFLHMSLSLSLHAPPHLFFALSLFSLISDVFSM